MKREATWRSLIAPVITCAQTREQVRQCLTAPSLPARRLTEKTP
jgi:hypothetical protein